MFPTVSALIPPPPPLLRRQVLEARRPPAGADGLGELARQSLGLDLSRERLVVVTNRHELDAHLAVQLRDRVPRHRVPVVGRPADGADVYDVAARGQAPAPGDAGVRDEDEIGPGAPRTASGNTRVSGVFKKKLPPRSKSSKSAAPLSDQRDPPND